MAENDLVDREIEKLLRLLMSRILPIVPAQWGLSVFLCSRVETASSFYISSMERESFLEAMQEFMVRNGYVLLKRADGQTDDLGRKSDA